MTHVAKEFGIYVCPVCKLRLRLEEDALAVAAVPKPTQSLKNVCVANG
jgi:hypothetical protein